ncbi:MAG: phospho-N-acetylmuramoyl-pentapeptide-transferase [Lachnospiraceae bacterium]|nr:phospho-N-acetylmuramoyl-pentapeptide-transferase [Lachnospiraceae bacterium]
MLLKVIPQSLAPAFLPLGILIAFFATYFAIEKCMPKMPRDHGKALAVEGAVSKGKATGVGMIFVTVFVITALLLAPISIEMALYLVLLLFCRLTGFLDDAAKTPWGRTIKGLLDLVVAGGTAGVYLYFHPPVFRLAYLQLDVTVPVWLYALLIIALVWGSINVTNCTDGVDSLSATLSIITLFSFYAVITARGVGTEFGPHILLFVAALAAYLWYNAPPSTALMGDAGSRAIGYFIALAALMCGSPLLYLSFALVIILDGGLGLFKITVIRLTKKKNFMNRIKTPLHDHARKNLHWEGSQVLVRFAALQLLASLLTVSLIR